MNFEIKYSKDLKKNEEEKFIREMLELDSLVYPLKFQGTYPKVMARFQANKDSYINLYLKNKLIAYICFFPITDDLSKRIDCSHREFADDIEARDILPFQERVNNTIFVISIVVHKDYQNAEAIKILTNEFIRYLKEKDEQNYFINRIISFASTDDGFKIFRTLNFHQVERFEDNTRYLECKKLELRLENYQKSYDSDLYIILPYHAKNNLVIDSKVTNNKMNNEYLKDMNINSNYECNSAIVSDLKRYYLGQENLALFSNDYDENIYGKITVDMFMTYHESTHLCMITLMNLNNSFSPTQIQDQVTTGRLSIFDEKNNLLTLDNYLEKKYGLEKISDGKILLSTSNTPKDIIELEYMLASESYQGKKCDYILASKEFKKQADLNLSQYDFCEVYAGIDSIIYVLKDFSKNPLINIRRETLILYIMEVVMFQNAAVLRTNNKIIEALNKSGTVSLAFIENLYIEFGQTIKFWNIDVFNYPAVQNLANHISQAFETQKILDDYYKNQDFLEHIVNLRDVQNSNRESKLLNLIVLFLTIVQVIPLIITFINWVTRKVDKLELVSWASIFSLTLLVIVILLKRKYDKKKKRLLK